MKITGNGNRAPNQQARRTVVTMSPSPSFTNCGVGGDNSVVITTGSLSGNGTATWAWPAQQGGTPTLVSFELTRSGTLTFSKNSGGRSCSVSLTTSGQGDQFNTTGKVCDKEVQTNQKPLGMRK